jgi:hypothetical protein
MECDMELKDEPSYPRIYSELYVYIYQQEIENKVQKTYWID